MADDKELDAAFPSQSEVDTAFPVQQAAPASTNAIQQAKEWLLRAPPEGQRPTNLPLPDYGPDVKRGEADVVGQGIRQGLGYVLPGSWPALMSMGIGAAVPGVGTLPTLGRIAGGIGAGAGVEAIRGGDPMAGGIEGGLGMAGGELLGGIGRAVGRKVSSMMGPESLTSRAGAFTGEQAQALQGASGADTVRKIMSGEGQQALSQQYREGLSSALSSLPPDTYIPVPSLAALGQKGGSRDIPELFSPADALTKIQSLQRSLSSVTGDTSRRKMALNELSLLENAEQEFAAGLQQVSRGTQAADQIAAASAKYAEGKALMRLFTGGREGMTRAQSERFLQQGNFDQGRQIEMNYLRQQGDLGSKLPADAAQTLNELVRRGETLPLAISKPGATPDVRFHLGVLPTFHGLPRAPQPIGATNPNAVADVLRQLGIGATLNSFPSGR